MKSTSAVFISVVILVAAATPLCAQDQMNLGVSLINSHFNGNGSPIVTMLIPSIYFNNGVYTMASGSATATGHMQSNGSYQIYTVSNNPFYLVHNPDDSFTVVQNTPINFIYTSPQGTLTGLLWFQWMSKTDNQLRSTLTGMLTSPGGSYAPYMPNGGTVSISFGLSFPLQLLWQVHGFSAAEAELGSIIGTGNCQPLSQGYWKNHRGAWRDGSGLWLGTNFYSNDQLVTLLQTPVRGDASMELAHQLIAALLNMANGTTGAPIQATVLDANNMIGSGILPEHIRPSSPVGQQMEGDASILDDYNNGRLTTGCSQ